MLARQANGTAAAEHQGIAVIAIVDYKAGNLASVKKAFDHLDEKNCVTDDPDEIRKAAKIVLPGVGHFAATLALNQGGLRDAIVEALDRGTPFLGICVGMQWMLSSSEEAPDVPGLALWPEQCGRFPAGVKSPHVGWNSLQCSDRSSTLLRGVEPRSYVYFTHSYRVPLLEATTASCTYGGTFSAVIEDENRFGVQFHPEKSGAVGLRILQNFCQC